MGGQCGLKPEEVLDMSLDVFQAYVKGYGDRLFDQQIVALQSGYWSAYYANAKHPKPMHKIAEDMMKRRKNEDAKKLSAPKPDVDVEAFLAVEAEFQARLGQV